MRAPDLEAVIDLHAREFSTSLFTRLGRVFLRAYLTTFIDAPHAVALVAVDGHGSQVGYLVGVVDTGGHRAWIKRHRAASLTPGALLGLTRHPILLSRIASRRLLARFVRPRVELRQGQGTSGGAPCGSPRTATPAVLSYVAVEPRARGIGAGSELLSQFERRAIATGASRMTLATATGGAACDFYERRGWSLERTRQTVDGRPMSFYACVVREVR